MTVIDGALDGTGIDKVRMKIYNKSTHAIIYDNQPGASDAANPVAAVGTNSTIVIQGTGNNNLLTKSSNLATKVNSEVVPETTPNTGLELSAYPNPFSTISTIRYGLPVDAHVSLSVYNQLGQKVAQLTEGNLSAGYHQARFDATKLAAGIYLYRLLVVDAEGKPFVISKKMIVAK
jgi:hypothetical protein